MWLKRRFGSDVKTWDDGRKAILRDDWEVQPMRLLRFKLAQGESRPSDPPDLASQCVDGRKVVRTKLIITRMRMHL